MIENNDSVMQRRLLTRWSASVINDAGNGPTQFPILKALAAIMSRS